MSATATHERPILFSASMVKAILAGTKTQTRRVIRPQAESYVGDVLGQPQMYAVTNGTANPAPIRCPYGVPGDRLWVREAAWYDRERVDSLPLRCFFEDSRDVRFEDGSSGWTPYTVNAGTLAANGTLRKRPGIHMPRWASRIDMDVVSVRVERLQEITQADVIAEGVQLPVCSDGCPPGKARPLVSFGEKHSSIEYLPKNPVEADFYRATFASLWDSINADRAPWSRSPWVWVVEFRRTKP